MPQEILQLRKENAYLKMEMDKLRKKLEIKEEYYFKWRDLKI
jgi:regulator of replication initiation timing